MRGPHRGWGEVDIYCRPPQVASYPTLLLFSKGLKLEAPQAREAPQIVAYMDRFLRNPEALVHLEAEAKALAADSALVESLSAGDYDLAFQVIT